MFGYDYCFCDFRDCPRTDCKRHRNWMPVGVPVSISDFRDFRKENGDCEYFWEAHPERSRLNLNILTEDELVVLGLSRGQAMRIVRVRESRGGFQKVSELLTLRGIGKVTYEKVCNLLYVEEPKREDKLDKVIRGLECCLDGNDACPGCYLYNYEGCRDQLNMDALDLLKGLKRGVQEV